MTAIDTEFTGLKINEETKSSLFDDAEDRYKKLREIISQITIAQLGKHKSWYMICILPIMITHACNSYAPAPHFHIVNWGLLRYTYFLFLL